MGRYFTFFFSGAIGCQSYNAITIVPTWLATIFSALLVGLFFWLYYLSRLRRWQERVIEAEKGKVLRLQKHIAEDELRRAKAELSDFTEDLRQKNELIQSLTAQLETRPKTTSFASSDSSSSLLKVRRELLEASLLTNDDWDEFRRQFERIHPEFFWQLKIQFPETTPAEERLLSLSKLRLDDRQMARMLGISPHAIRMARYRMRKKMGADGNFFLSKLLENSLDDELML